MNRFAVFVLAFGVVASACGPDRCLEKTPGTLCPIAGVGGIGYNGEGLLAEETKLNLLSRVRRGPDRLLYLMDFNNFRLRRIDDDGRIRTAVGSGVHGFADTKVPALESPLENPIDFDYLPDGRVVIVSYHDPRVLVLEDDGRLHAIAGTSTVGDSGDGGPALEAEFNQLDGIAIAPDGTIYVSDSRANRVRRIRDGVVTTVAGTGEPGTTGDGGPGHEAQLDWPTSLTLDGAGNLYITERVGCVVRKLAPDGVITTIAGTGGSGFSGDGGAATAAELNWPDGLAVEADGTIYLADGANFRVRKIDPNGVITTIAGVGVNGSEGIGGDALEAEFGFLSRVTLDGDSLLVADQSNSFARRLYLER